VVVVVVVVVVVAVLIVVVILVIVVVVAAVTVPQGGYGALLFDGHSIRSSRARTQACGLVRGGSDPRV